MQLVFTGLGLLFVIAGGRAVYRYLLLSLTGERVSATVAALRWKERGTGRLCYPVLVFRTLDGRDIRAEAGVGRSRVLARPGDRVPVIYDRHDPAKAEIDTAAGRVPGARVFFALAGAAMIYLGLFGAQVRTALEGTPPLFIGGLAFAAVGGYGIRRYRHLNRTGVRVSASVVELRWRAGGDGRVCHPIVAFRTLDGRDIRAETGIGTGAGKPGVGTQVQVIYDPRDPRTAELATRARLAPWIFALSAVIGVGLICYGLVQVAGGKG